MGNLFAVLFGVLPVMLITLVLPAALVILLQMWLCKRGKWLGLILPCLTLTFSLILTLGIGAFSTLTFEGGSLTVYDEHGNIVKEIEPEHHHKEISHIELLPVAGIFLVSNIPTVVLGGIWLNYRNKSEWKEDLRRMNIQDLE